MGWFEGLRHRVRTVLNPGAYERELREEMDLHRHLDAQQLGDEDAARRRFGNTTSHIESTRDATWFRLVDVIAQDLRYAWRSMRRAPGFTAAVVVILALGIGLNAAMFSFLDRLYLRPPSGVVEPDALRRLWITRYSRGSPSAPYQSLSFAHYAAVREALRGVAEVAYFNTNNAMALGRDHAGPPVHGVWATASYFPVLGARPALGRVFGADEDVLGNPTPVAVVSHHFWKTRLGSDSAILGRELAFGPRKVTVIGVLEPGFSGLDVQAADVWFPIASFTGTSWDRKPFWQSTTTWGGRSVLRVAPGVSAEELATRATAALRRTERELNPARPDTLQRAQVASIIEARGPGVLDRQLVVASRLGTVAMVVLLVACANVVNLLLARAVYRRREIAVRLALGVSRSRLYRMITTETVLIALIAGAAAMLTAWWAGSLLRTLILPNIEWVDGTLDRRVTAFTLAIAIVAGLVAGLLPAFQATNPRLTEALKSGSEQSAGGRTLLRDALVVSQTAMSLVLIVLAALFVRSLQAVREVDLGYDPERVVYTYLYFNEGEDPSRLERAGKLTRIAREFDGRAGVEAVALASAAPMRGYSALPFFTARDSIGTLGERTPAVQIVTPGFFTASGLRIVRGRSFAGPTLGGPSNELVVDQYAARLLWPDEDPIGQCVRFVKPTNACLTVVGVSESTRRFGVLENQHPAFHLPLGSPVSSPGDAYDLVLRVSPEALGTVQAALDAALRREFPLATSTSKTMSESLHPQYQPWRMAALLFTAFGVLALIVALFGIYSSVTYAVGQRTREFGIRIAMGARMRNILNQVVGEGFRLVTIGVGAGIILSLVAGRIVASMLFGVQPMDASAMLLAASLMLGVSVLASAVPAVRAARVDPVKALRAE